MTKRHNAKYKIDRRLGVNLWGRPKSPFNRRNSKPGQHGVQGQRKKLSDYGNQLFAKQKLKFYYGDLTERQFRNIFKKASNIKGDTSQILIELLERRLDATVYRMKFVPTIFSARQLVNHGHVKVNGKRVNIPSYSVSDGDEISIRDKSKEINLINIKFYQKLFIVLISLSTILIFPESPRELENICKSYNSNKLCNVW